MVRFNKETTRLIRLWLVKNGFDCSARLGSSFLYEPDEHFIAIPRFYRPKNIEIDAVFMAFLRENGLKVDFDSVTLSVLHELGHAETLLYYFTDEEILNDMLLKEVISYSDCPYEDDLRAYWSIPTEYIANKFAIEYANNFPKEVQELEDILSTTMEVW